MKWLWIVATALVATLLAAGPALAMDAMCEEATIQSLSNCVQQAYTMGHIYNQGVELSLLSETGAAQAALDHGQRTVAVNTLQAFIQDVLAVRGTQIQAEHADHMVQHAKNVIQAIKQPAS